MEAGTAHPYFLIGKSGEQLKQNDLSQGINNKLEFVIYNKDQDTWIYVYKSDELNKTLHILKTFDGDINDNIFVKNFCRNAKKLLN